MSGRDRANTAFLAAFPELHRKVMGRDLSAIGYRSEVRSFFLDCVPENSDHRYGYRYLDLDLEGDLAAKLDAFKPVEDGDLYQVDAHHLKLLRRLAFQRYAFGLAAEISRRLLKQDRKHRVRRWWVYKDFVLPRVPLALAVGYGIVLGSFKDWLVVLGKNGYFVAGLAIVTLGLSWFLIYCNVRDRIGDRLEVNRRAWAVFGGCVIWSGILLRFGGWLAEFDSKYAKDFNWGVAICLGCSSLLVAIVAQFFFAKAGSIADPL